MSSFRTQPEHFLNPDKVPLPSLTTEQNFVWLLRTDVRTAVLRSTGSSFPTLHNPSSELAAPELCRFLIWWALNQQSEYPKAGPLTDNQIAYLNQQFISQTGAGDVPVTRLMLGVWELLDYIRQRFDLETGDGRRGLFNWYFLSAVSELGLEQYVSDGQRAALARPVLFAAATGQPLTQAMLSVWQLRADLQEAFDLRSDAGIQGFLSWVQAYGGQEFPALALYGDRAPRQSASSAMKAPARIGHRRRKQTDRPYGINLIGFARGELGIGEDVRMAAEACAAAGIPFSVYDIPPGPTHRQADRRLEGHITTDAPYAINLFCLTGFDTVHAYIKKPELFEGRVNIGYWPWELPGWPEPWSGAYDIVDEVWVSTRYTQEAFALTSPVPVLLMPMAVTVTQEQRYSRADFGLPEDRFLFLFTFDWNSYVARKNPMACIRAFQEAFPIDGEDRVGLVFKVMGGQDHDPHWRGFMSAVAADPRITVLNGTFDRLAVLDLVRACDAVVSLHRSEGFGRTLAEAMLLGKPTIATNYSGNTDFCTPETCALVPAHLIPVGPGEYPWGEGMYWAEADVGQAALAMRKVFCNDTWRDAIAKAGYSLISGRHNIETVGARYTFRIKILAGRCCHK